jgi:hypothetical protein
MIPDRMRRFAQIDHGRKEPCWEWQGAKDAKGYGHVSYRGRNSKTHRVFYEFAFGPIPAGLVIDHVCRNRICCNPSHLRAVTPQVNTLENSEAIPALNLAKTRCPQDHDYTPENTYHYVLKGIRIRRCKQCHSDYSRRIRQAKKLANLSMVEG